MTTVKENLKRLLRTGRGKGRLTAAPSRDPLGISTSEGVNAASQSVNSGNGIASPLTETINSATTYTITSSDGLFSFEIPQQTTYEDASTAEVVVIHKAPT